MARTGNLRRLIADELPDQVDVEADASGATDPRTYLTTEQRRAMEERRANAEADASGATDPRTYRPAPEEDDGVQLFEPIATDFESKRVQVPDYTPYDPISLNFEAQRVQVPPKSSAPRLVVGHATADLSDMNRRLQALLDPDGQQTATADAGQVRPGSMKGFFQQAITGTGAPNRKPLVSPEVAAFVAKQTGAEAPDPDAAAMEAAKRRAGMDDTLASLTDQIAIANGTYNAGRSARLHGGAQQGVADEEAKQQAVRDFVAKKLGLERQARQDQRQTELDDLNRRNIESEIATRERGKQPAPVDPLEQEKTRAEIARIQAETDKLKARPGAGGQSHGAIAKPGAQIPAGEAAQVGQYDAALKMLDDLEGERKQKTGALSGLTQYLPGTDAAEYSDATLQAAQTIGTILEGGKLTDADLPKYLRMLPTAGDSDERANAKLARIREAIRQTKASKIQGLSSAGFNTSGFDSGSATTQSAPGGKVRVSNGTESYLIDPSDLADAERDGFKRVD